MRSAPARFAPERFTPERFWPINSQPDQFTLGAATALQSGALGAAEAGVAPVVRVMAAIRGKLIRIAKALLNA